MTFENWFSQTERSTDIRVLPVTAQIGVQAVALPEYHKVPL